MSKILYNTVYENVLNNINAGVLYCKNDNYSTIIYANDYFYQMIGYTREEYEQLHNNRFSDLVLDDVSEILKDINQHIKENRDLDFEYRMKNKNGDVLWIHDTAKYDYENNCWYVTIMDISEMKSIEYERERLLFYLNHMPNKIIITDLEGEIIYRNQYALDCSYFDSNIHYLDKLIGNNILGKDIKTLLNVAKSGQQVEFETRYKHNDQFIGHDKNCLIPIKDRDSDVLNYMVVCEDLLTINDGLTNFPSRIMLENYYLKYTQENDNTPVFLAIIDIDDFKNINDTYGHYIGDEIIRLTANNLSKLLNEEDYICRYGGDEFIVLFINQTIDKIIEYCKQIHESCLNCTQLQYQNIKFSYSIGIAQGNSSDEYHDLLKKADQALYQVKSTGKGNYKIY